MFKEVCEGIGENWFLSSRRYFIKPEHIVKFFVFLVFLFGNFFVFVPTRAKAMMMLPYGTLMGTITNSQTGNILANTNFDFNGRLVKTDSNGNYSAVADYCGSVFDLEVNSVGYDTKKIENINVQCWNTLQLNVGLYPTPEWRRDIQPGDILYDPYTFGVGHTALYIGDGQVVEAQGDAFNWYDSTKNQVFENPISEWDYPNRADAYILRVAKPANVSVDQFDKIKADAIQFALDQIGKPYDWDWLTKHSDHDASSWYCSELVWAAYINQGIDLEYYPDPDGIISPVSPSEIFLDNNVYQINSHLVHQPGSTLRDFTYLLTFSPVDVTVTDDSGNITNKDTLGIPGAFFIHNDFDPVTGHFHDTFILPNYDGDYHISAVKKADAAPTDTYTMVWETGDKRTVLAQDQTVPQEGQAVSYQISTKPVVQDLNAVVDEDKSIDVALAGSDIYDDPLNYSVVGTPLHGIESVLGNIATYTPEPNYNGSDSFTYKASDGTDDSNIATVSITVNSVPDISALAIANVAENSATFTWTTDEPSTSRVIYDTISHSDSSGAPNYGYASTTSQDSTKVINHSVTISSLAPATTYYFRAVSGGSSEVTSNEITAKTNAPAVTVGKSKIIGRVYEDHDGDGKIDLLDLLPGLSGWTVYLDANNNGKLDSREASTTSGLLGIYQLSNLPAGSYVVREVLKTDWIQTCPKNSLYVLTLSANQIVLAKSFGNFKPNTIISPGKKK